MKKATVATRFNQSHSAPRVPPFLFPPDTRGWVGGAKQNRKRNFSLLPLLPVHSNGLNGTVSVYPLEGSMAGMMPTAASANSPTAYTILDVDQNAYLFVGGIIGTVKVFCLCLCLCVCSLSAWNLPPVGAFL